MSDLQTPRSQGYWVESIALKDALTVVSAPDLEARANAINADIQKAMTDASYSWRLYTPSWLGGIDSGELDAIGQAIKDRFGVNPLDVPAPPFTGGPVGELADLGSGSAGKAASAGGNAIRDALPDVPSPGRITAYLLPLLLLLLVLAFIVWDVKGAAARLVRV